MASKTSNGHDLVEDVRQQTEENMQAVQAQLHDAVSDAGEKAERAKGEARKRAKAIQSDASHTAHQAKSGLADALHQASDRVRQKANEQGRADLADKVAEPLSGASDYVRDTPLDQMSQDLMKAVRSNPWPYLVGVIILAALLWAFRDMTRSA